MKLYTIGFTKTTAKDFFGRLQAAGVRSIIDTRLHRDGQLSGFAKAADLKYFTETIMQGTYIAETLLAPTDEILKAYQKKALTWAEYEDAYRALLAEREAASKIDVGSLDNAVLLCSEHKADRCHRRLAAEFLQDSLRGRVNVEIVHL